MGSLADQECPATFEAIWRVAQRNAIGVIAARTATLRSPKTSTLRPFVWSIGRSCTLCRDLPT